MDRKIKYIITLVILIMAGTMVNTDDTEAKPVKISSKNPMVVMRVSHATGKFNESWGGVMQAVPQKDTDVYTLYDVIIWNDRISLYKFKGNIDEEWNKYYGNYVEAHNNVQVSNAKYEQLYRRFRETNLLKEVKCKNIENNVSLNSKRRLAAYKSFLKIIHKQTPSKNVMIKYSGHGGGVSFCNSLTNTDTKKILNYGKKILGRKFSVIDYGTNCQSGTNSVLSFYQNYTDYMIVSQNDFGGYSYDVWDFETYKKVDTDYVYPKMFKKGETVKMAVRRIGKQHISEWRWVKKDMRKKNLPQSVTVVKMKEYKYFISSLKKAKKSAISYEDLKIQAKKYGGSPLLRKYNKAVIYYKNNAGYLKGKWKYGTGITCNENV